MVIKIYGSAMSTSRVLTVLHEMKLPYELNRVDISKGEHKSESYAELQPFGKVPVMDDDGFIMYESRAICRYLASKYSSGENLLPNSKDHIACGRFEQACSVEQSYFAAAAETIGTELFIRPAKGLGDPDLARVAQAEKDFEHVLSVYEDILANQEYIGGNALTVVDLFHLPNGAALKAGTWRELFAKYPNVDRWFEGLQERDSWIQAAAEAGTIA